MNITPKEWKSFQHYKERRPPWIKLHRPLLDNADFQRLPVASRALAPMLWLIAAEYENGTITATPEDIAWRLRMPLDEFGGAVKPLIDKGFFVSELVDSKPLAPCKQETQPEREAETQEQTERGGVVERAREPSKSLISEEAFKVAGDLLEAMGLDREHPLSVGAPMTVQSWLNGGWPAEIIKVGVQKAMQNRKHDPPSTLKYFEKAIARTHAEMSRPLPIAVIHPQEKVHVAQNARGGISSALDRLIQQAESLGAGSLEGSEATPRLLSNG